MRSCQAKFEILTESSDWERVIVIWKKSDDGLWRPAQLMLSQHSGYQTLDWGQIQNTFNDDTAGDRLGGPNGKQGLDHAKVIDFIIRLFIVKLTLSRCMSSGPSTPTATTATL